MRSASHVLIK